MGRKKITTTIYITPEQDEKLKILHRKTNVPIAVFIREGIDLILKRHEEKIPGQSRLFSEYKEER
ncbi:MAG: ribbon-helix-helix domain-containing protein [Deltaproteobacteria bacterium]|nr:ribbon-helix-helix domain-containing protein [Deltaproteobacteria bacterium]